MAGTALKMVLHCKKALSTTLKIKQMGRKCGTGHRTMFIEKHLVEGAFFCPGSENVT